MIPGQIINASALAVLAGCFLAFSLASFRHFDPTSKSAGNQIIRALTLAGTLLNLALVWKAWPTATALALASFGFGLVSLSLFRAALRSAPSQALHVVFTGSGPEQLVTTGVYARIRNPLYTSYLAYWAGWVPASGLHPVSVACFALFCVAYWIAAREEERFLTHQFGDQYLAFKSRTGRFLPRLN